MKKYFAICLVSALLHGCATPKAIVEKPYTANQEERLAIVIEKPDHVLIPSEQYALLESEIRKGLQEKGLLASSADNSAHTVTVKIHFYNMREDAARLTVGIIAGCDNITSTVVVKEKQTQRELGRSQISIEECAAWGVASQVITKYSDGVVAYLANK